MYTATITSQDFKGGVLSVVVVYSNGTEKIEETLKTSLIPSDTWLQDTISTRISQINALADFYNKNKLGVFTAPAETVQAPVETEESIWKKKVSVLNRMQAAADLGIIPPDDKSITDLKTEVQNDYKPEFLTSL